MQDKGQLALNWSFEFLKTLVKQGVSDAIISPGSRSTPLVLAAHQLKQLNKRVVVDERSAAFQALGIAKATNQPVVLICTSGTAAANYFPAIVEASLSRVPLIVITADRPAKLRSIGAQQTIDQVKLYGNHATYFELGEPNELDFRRLPVLASQVIHETSKAHVVHVNAAFRKPLEPNAYEPIFDYSESEPFSFSLPKANLDELILELSVAKRPLFIFGPVMLPSHGFSEIYEWAIERNIPCITESLSQLPVNCGLYEGPLRNSELRTFLKPDLIVRFGRQPVSKSVELYLETHQSVPHLHFDVFDVWHDATFTTSAHFFGKIDTHHLKDIDIVFDPDWRDLWKNLEHDSKTKRASIVASDSFTDGKVISQVIQWNGFSGIHLSNSYPIRDVEWFASLKNKLVYCNRGANGIDGVLSTAMGNSVSHNDFCTIIGDVAFLHDAASLAYHRAYTANHTILLINNGGGRIFEMLPIAQSAPEVLETYYQTAVPFHAEQICKAFGISYQRVNHSIALEALLHEQYQGLRLIECVTDARASQMQRKDILR